MISVLCVVVLAVIFTVQATVVDEDDVAFYLFTEKHQRRFHEITYENAHEKLDKDLEIIFIIHGWTENRTCDWYQDLTDVLLSRQHKGCNVIQVDWGKAAQQRYLNAVADSHAVGDIIGDFIVNLIEDHGFHCENFHICGHSLGGQIAGFIGKYVKNTIEKKLGRITALDPAGPLFVGLLTSYHNRLNRHDAEVVVVVHTDRLKFGYLSSCGTVDIYPNGGTAIQPGCPQHPQGETWFCSHRKSYEYYIDALRHPETFIATKCYSFIAYDQDRCGHHQKQIDLGGEITKEDSGDYFLKTNSEVPYGRGY